MPPSRQPPAPRAELGPGPACGAGEHRRAALGPRPGLLELRRHPEEQVLAAVRGDELHADRQAVRGPVQRERDRRLAGDVERRP